MPTKFKLAQRFMQEFPKIGTRDQFGTLRLNKPYSVEIGTVYGRGPHQQDGFLYKGGKYVASYDCLKDQVYR